jgi:hypothetical protein
MGKHGNEYTRQDKDFYPTPAWVTEALLQHLDVTGRNLWEPAAGTGNMAKVLSLAGAARIHCSDIANYGYPLDALREFTAGGETPVAHPVIITNPPGGPRNATAEAFIASGLRHIMYGGTLALLLSTDFDSAVTRRGLFDECRWFTTRIILTKRITWFDRADGVREAPKENHAWFVGEHSALRERRPVQTLYAPVPDFPRLTEGARRITERRTPCF